MTEKNRATLKSDISTEITDNTTGQNSAEDVRGLLTDIVDSAKLDEDLAAVAFSGDYDDLSNAPTLGTAAAKNTDFFATAAQGTLASTAVQPGELGTAASSDTGDFATASQGSKADSALQSTDIGDVSDYRSATDDALLEAGAVWDAAAVVALSDAATVAWSMSSGFNFSVSLSGNRTLGNPTNVKVGQRGSIAVTASSSDRTLAKSSNIKSADSITWPLEIASGTVAYLYYDAQDSSNILITGVINNPA